MRLSDPWTLRNPRIRYSKVVFHTLFRQPCISSCPSSILALNPSTDCDEMYAKVIESNALNYYASVTSLLCDGCLFIHLTTDIFIHCTEKCLQAWNQCLLCFICTKRRFKINQEQRTQLIHSATKTQ